MQLQYIPHKNIDFAKWDAALQNCSNKLIYAQSTYINTMAGTWNAIVNDDWSLIMPIPIKKKMGITYCPTVPFIPQLGIFGKTEITQQICDAFIAVLNQKIKFYDIWWNKTNIVPNADIKNNYILDLRKPYSELQINFAKNLPYDLKRDISYTIDHHFSVDALTSLFQKEYNQRLKHVKQADFNNLNKLGNLYLAQNKAICKAIIINNEVVAAVLMWKDATRLYNIASVITNIGKKNFANHFLYNSIIKEFEQSNYILDFEGSDIEGIAHFYQKFGAINEPYYFSHFNNLPFIVKLWKH